MSRKLNFITKSTSTSSKDISLRREIRDDDRTPRTCLTVRNNCDRKIGMSGYTVVAIDGDKLYFSNSSETVGYKLTSNGKGYNKAVSFTDHDLYKWAEGREGSYDLLFDSEINYWYIDTRKNISQ